MAIAGQPTLSAAVLLGLGRPAGDPETRPLAVLLAEAQPADRQRSLDVLEELGHVVHAVPGWPAALTYLSQHPVDVLLVDLALPAMARLDPVRRLRGWPPPLANLPVLGLFGRPQPGQAEACRQAGLDGVLVRPLEARTLEAALRGAVLARTPPDPLDRTRRDALRALLGKEAMAARDEAAMTTVAGLIRTMRYESDMAVVQQAVGTVATELEGIGAVVAAAAARALAVAPERRPQLLPPLFTALVATRVALRRG